MTMERRPELRKLYTLRHFLFYMGLSCLVGAIIGSVAGTMDWSDGLVYAVTIPVALAIVAMALRESLFAPVERRHPGHRAQRGL